MLLRNSPKGRSILVLEITTIYLKGKWNTREPRVQSDPLQPINFNLM